MSDRNQNPDRANTPDNDGIDVPTYRNDQTTPTGGSTPTGSSPASPARNAQQDPTPTAGRDDATTQFPRGTAGTAGTGAATGGDVYNRAGRAAPQEIPPEPRQARPEPRTDARTEYLQDSPRDNYQDQDFAPTGSRETVSFDRNANHGEPAYQDTTYADPAPVAAAPVVEEEHVVTETTVPDHRRGTIDFGLLIIRLLLGIWLILEAVGTFFRLGGNEGISGLESEYANYLAPGGLAIIVPSLQLAAGVFLVLGLITPLFAMVATIVTAFTALHALTGSGAGLNVFAWSEGVWLSVILFGISLALQFTGPGLYSFDYGRSWARRPLVSSWIFILLAIAGAVALWWFGAGVNPLS